jgi:ligand-binding sensor domain-containing protein
MPLSRYAGEGIGERVAQSHWRPDERVVIGDFSHVQAVAAGRTAVYAVTTGGLVVYERRFGRWETPVTPVDGFPDVPVRSALVDPADESLWLATDAGLIHYRQQLRQVEVLPGGPIGDLMFDRDDPVRGLFVRTERGWELLARGQIISLPTSDLPPLQRRLRPLSLAAALQRFPAVEAMGPTSLLDRRLRRYDLTAAAVPPDENEAFFGTNGLGLYRFDALVARLEPLPFGLRSQVVGGLMPISGAVWLATNGGFTRLGDDFQTVQYEEGGTTSPVFREARDLIARGFELWAATDRGIVRFQPGSAWQVIDVGDGLPSDRCLVLAPGPLGVWIGTDRGLALAREDGKITVLGQMRPTILALLAARDSVWVGTGQGLRLVAEGSPELVIPEDVDAEPALRAPVVALARTADTVIAATPERIAWRPPHGAWVVERALGSEIGPLRALAGDRGGVWIGGERGLAFFRFSGRSFVTWHSAEDLPAPVRKMAVAGPYLWIGTERGLVRYTRKALVP